MSFPIMPFMRKVKGVDPDLFIYTNSVSALEIITVPATGTNNFTINWGDGTTPELVTTSSPTHQYIDADSYQISISGTMTQFAFNNVGSNLNVTSFDQFGSTGLINVERFAYGCENCTVINVDNWDSSSITSLHNFARQCESLVTFDVSNLDISNITNVTNFVLRCFSLVTVNTDNWDTRNITVCTNAFQGLTLLTSAFDEFRWWNRTDDLTSGGTPDPIGSFVSCFKDSFDISNYASIPNNWKGL